MSDSLDVSSDGDLTESHDEDEDEDMFKDPEQKRQEALAAARKQRNENRRAKWHEQKEKMKAALAAAHDRLEQYELDTAEDKEKAAAKQKKLELELRSVRTALDDSETKTNTLQAEVSRIKMTAGRSSHLRRRHRTAGAMAGGSAAESDAGLGADGAGGANLASATSLNKDTAAARGWVKQRLKKTMQSKYCQLFVQAWGLATRCVRVVTLRGAVANIRRRYGGSVSSFFDFFQKIYIKFAILSFALLILFFIHVYHLWAKSYSSNTSDGLLATGTGSAQLVFAWADADWYGSWESFVPKLFLPSSFDPGDAIDDEGYNGKGAQVSTGTWNVGERLRAAMTLAGSAGFVILATIVMVVGADKEFRQAKVAELSGKSMRFAELAIARWDLSITAEDEVKLASVNLVNQMEVLIYESHTKADMKSETPLKKFLKWTRRTLGLVIFIIVISLTAACLLGVTAQKVRIENAVVSLANSVGLGSSEVFTNVVKFLAALIVPVSLALANALLPKAVHGVALLGNWTPQWHMYVKLSGLFLGKIFNLAVVIVGFMMLADPYMLRSAKAQAASSTVATSLLEVLAVFGLDPHSARVAFQQTYAPAELKTCRADAAAVAVFQLVVTSFPIRWLASLFMPVLKIAIMLLSKKKTWLKAEFLLEDVTMTLLYTVMMALLSLVFMPFSIIFLAPLFLLDFLYEWFLVSRCKRKPIKPWNAKGAVRFFLNFYVLVVAIFIGIVYWFAVTSTFPQSCGTSLIARTAQNGVTTGSARATFMSASIEINFGDLARGQNDPLDLALANAESSGNQLEEYTFWTTVGDQGYATSNMANAAALRTWLGANKQLSIDSTLFVCAQACGPYVYSRNAFAPLVAWLKETAVVSTVYALLSGSDAVWFWLLFVTVILTQLLKRGNLVRSMEQEIALLSAEDEHVAQLERKHKNRAKGGGGDGGEKSN